MAERNLYKKIGEMEYANLFADVTPSPVVAAASLSGGDAGTAFHRGDLIVGGALYTTDSDLTKDAVDGILCEDLTVAAAGTATAAVYKCGSFNINAIGCGEGADLTDAALKQELDRLGIYLKAVDDLGE